MTFDWKTTSRSSRPAAAPAPVDRQAAGRAADQAHARRDLPREQAAEHGDEHPEDQRVQGYFFPSSFTSSGTTSNRSPTIP